MLIGQGGAIAENFARPDESQGLCALGAPFAVEAHGAFQHVIKEVGNVILPVDDFVFGEDVFALGGKEARALLGGEGFAKGVRKPNEVTTYSGLSSASYLLSVRKGWTVGHGTEARTAVAVRFGRVDRTNLCIRLQAAKIFLLIF